MKHIHYLILLISFSGFTQSPAGIWYFGKNAGISFNTGNNPVSINDGQIDTNEGCATLCDTNGNLLFYTDGVKVWNKNHLVMQNGFGLQGDPSSTQSAIIVPKPNSSNLFYVFTVDELGKSNGLKYSIIDLTLDNGLGDIITKNVPLISPALEKITVVQHANNIDYWVIAHKYGNNQYVSYLLSGTGLSTTPIISSVGTSVANDTQRTLGYMKSSPNGQFIATAHAGLGSNVQLLNFNNTSGLLSLLATMPVNSNSLGAYGLEFSSNSKLLYITRIDYPTFTSEIIQFNIEIPNETIINTSQIVVGSYFFDQFSEGIITALQLAPNQKIYVGRNNTSYLDVINKPNLQGLNCNYVPYAVNIHPNTCYYGLPSFITSYLDLTFTSNNYCTGSPTQFEIPEIDDIVSIVWNFGDVSSPNNSSGDDNPLHTFSTSGNYTVALTIQTLTNTKVFTKQITILEAPIAHQPTNYLQCEVTNNQASFDLLQKNNEILGSQSPSNYIVSYHLTQNDADNNTNPMASTYSNTSNPQLVYARVQPVNGNDCFDTTSFQLITVSKPSLSPDESIYYCLENFPQTISIAAGNLNPAQSLSYVWSTGETTESIQVNQANNYSVTATNSTGCSATRTVQVIASEIAAVSYNILGTIGNNSVQIIALGSGNYTYALDNEFGNYQTSPIFNSVTAGNHVLYVKDEHGCGTASTLFSVIGYPKYFTPNNDGENDYWNLQGSFLEIKKTLIYDRYGKLMFELQPNSKGWDGNYNGIKMLSTDYWFTTTFTNGKEIRGHFSLKR